MTATAAVRERPIIFSGPMVRAVWDGRKSQTRRVVRPQPTAVVSRYWDLGNGLFKPILALPDFDGELGGEAHKKALEAFYADPNLTLRCPYGAPGDRLWIKERWFPAFARTATNSGVMFPSFANPHGAPLGHPQEANPGWSPNGKGGGWKSPIHMPRWASRITLEITDVRVQRLQEISEEDAIAEGWEKQPHRSGDPEVHRDAARDWFADLWDSVNAKRGYSWGSNPWVWVLSFTRAGRIG